MPSGKNDVEVEIVSTRGGILIPVAIAWLGLVCATALIAVAWFSHTGNTSGAVNARGVAGVTASGVSDPPWTSGVSDPPWT